MKTKQKLTTTIATLPIAAMSLGLIPSVAQAFTLSNSSGTWTGTNGGNTVNGRGTNQVRWGDDIPQSGLQFDGVDSTNFEIDQTFKVGTLTHFNNPAPNPASGATLNIDLNLSDPALNKTFGFNFGIDETTNKEPCKYPSPDGNPCADKIFFPSSLPSESFSFNGKNYTLQLVGFGSDPNSLIPDFFSQERDQNSTSIWAKIVEDTRKSDPTAKTPEPFAIGGLGIVSVYLMMSRKKQKIAN
jgi:hypothetical protein